MGKRVCAWLVAVCMLFAVVCEPFCTVPEVQAASISGDGTQESPYHITSVDDMEALAAEVNAGDDYADKYISLDVDLDYTGKTMTPIGTLEHAFAGTFEGNGKTITGFALSDNKTDYRGLFGYNKGTIQNLKLSGATIENTGKYTGAISGYNEGTILNVTVEDSRINGATYTGGITGYSTGTLEADKIVDSEVKGGIQCGGVVGASSASIKNCGNDNSYVEGTTYLGGIVGDALKNSVCVIDGCYNTGHIHDDTGRSAGIVGRLDAKTTVKNCWNAGLITAGVEGNDTADAMNIGGIVGTGRGTILNCLNAGELRGYGAAASFTGGICGGLEEEIVAVDNCVNFGDVYVVTNSDTLSSYVGGLFGRGNFKGKISNCYTTGTVGGVNTKAGAMYVGAYAGRLSGTVENAFYLASDLKALGRNELDGIVSMTEEELKDDGFLTALNAAVSEENGFAEWKSFAKCYNGYPFLALGERHSIGIYVASLPTKTEYAFGEELDTTGLAIELVYSDGTTENVASGYTVQGFNSSLFGACTVTVLYREFHAEFAVTVKEIEDLFSGGEGTQEDPYQLTNTEDMAILAAKVASGDSYEGKFFRLKADLDYSQETPVVIGTDKAHSFAGTFDGNEKTITGFSLSGKTADNQGFFGYNTGTIRNLKLSEITVENTGKYTGAVAGYNEGTILNVTVEDSRINGAAYTGGITGYSTGALEKDQIKDSEVKGGTPCGGIVGAATASVKDCGNDNSYVEGTLYMGGIVGDAEANTSCVIDGCYNTGHIHNDTGRSAGIVGRLNYNTTIKNSWNAGLITAGTEGDDTTTGLNIGGIVGTGRGTILNCLNAGELKGYGAAVSFSGGICGGLEADMVAVDNCVNFGDISVITNSDTLDAYVGGLFGRGDFKGKVTNCYSTGTVSGVNTKAAERMYVGAYAGSLSGTVENASYLATDQLTALGSGELADITAKTAEKLKADDFLTAFNAAVSEENGFATWKSFAKCYDGYPFLDLAERYPTGIYVASLPAVTEYTLGEDFDQTGLSVELVYSDENVEDVTSECELKGFDSAHLGDCKVTVSYKGYQTAFVVNVKEKEEEEQFSGGEGTQEDPYQIAKAEDLEQLAQKIEIGKSYKNNYFLMEADIDISGKTWNIIGTDKAHAFDGIFDGNGKTITGVVLSDKATENIGLFGYNTGTIRNLKLSEVSIENTEKYTGAVAGYNEGTILNVTVEDSRINGAAYTGGITGYSTGALEKDQIKDSEVKGGTPCGGIVGASTASVKDCSNDNSYVEGTLYMGGIVGDAEANTSCVIDGCYNTGHTHNDTGRSAGIVGRLDSNTTVKNCWNAGVITAGTEGDDTTIGLNIGGIVGTGRGTILNCLNAGELRGYGAAVSFTGGICGGLETDMVAVDNCVNFGDISVITNSDTLDAYVGGLFGRGNFKGKVTNCYSTGTVSGVNTKAGEMYVGAYAGSLRGTVENASYLATDQLRALGEGELADITAKTAEELKADDFLTAFNAAVSEENGFVTWKKFEKCYNGYPFPDLGKKHPTGIYAVSLPKKMEYLLGEDFEEDGLGIELVYSDGSTEALGAKSYTIEKPENNQVGKALVTVSYQCYKAEFDITYKASEELTVTELKILHEPDLLKYEEKQALDTTGLSVQAVFSDESTAIVTADCTIEGFDSSAPGECVVTVSYRGAKAQFTVTILGEEEARLCAHFSFDGKISDDSGNNVGLFNSSEYNKGALRYVEGISGQAVGMAARATSNVKNQVIRLQNNVIPTGSTRYTISLWVNPTSLSNFCSAFFSQRTSQWLNMAPGGDRIDEANGTTNPSIWIYNTDGVDNLDISYNLKYNTQLPLGQWTMITYTYAGGTACLYINGKLVDVQKEVVNALGGTNQTFYLLGNTLVDASFDGYIDELYLYKMELSPEKVAKLYHEQKPADKILEKISVAASPRKTEYNKGEAFDKTGLKVEAYYYGQKEPVEVTDYTVEGFDSSKEGSQAVLIHYGDCTTAVEVTVGAPGNIEVPSGSKAKAVYVLKGPEKTEYYLAEAFDPAGMRVVALYEDGIARITDDFKVEFYSSILAGRTAVRVSVDGIMSEAFFVEVLPVQDNISGIELASAPAKQVYYIGESLDIAGLKVNAVYLNQGKRSIYNGYLEISGFDSSTAGTKTITVRYMDYSLEFEVEVKEPVQPELISIAVTRKPNKVQYYLNEKLDISGMIVTAVYDNGETKAVKDYQVSGGDTKKLGDSQITVTYQGKTAIVTIRVVEKENPVVQKKLTLKKTKATVWKGKKFQIQATATPSAKITYKSKNTKIASVNSKGLVTAKKKGSVVITVKANGITKQCKITVKNPTLSLKKTKLTLKKGKKVQIKATAKPSAKIKYKSLNKKIATVSSKGMITAKKKGQTTIQVTANGVVKKCKITVK